MDIDGIHRTISASQKEKDLGVIMSNDLKWADQVNQVVNKANRMLGIIRNTFKSFNFDSFKLLYQSLVRPHLDYAVSVWNPN